MISTVEAAISSVRLHEFLHACAPCAPTRMGVPAPRGLSSAPPGRHRGSRGRCAFPEVHVKGIPARPLPPGFPGGRRPHRGMQDPASSGGGAFLGRGHKTGAGLPPRDGRRPGPGGQEESCWECSLSRGQCAGPGGRAWGGTPGGRQVPGCCQHTSPPAGHRPRRGPTRGPPCPAALTSFEPLFICFSAFDALNEDGAVRVFFLPPASSLSLMCGLPWVSVTGSFSGLLPGPARTAAPSV